MNGITYMVISHFDRACKMVRDCIATTLKLAKTIARIISKIYISLVKLTRSLYQRIYYNISKTY